MKGVTSLCTLSKASGPDSYSIRYLLFQTTPCFCYKTFQSHSYTSCVLDSLRFERVSSSIKTDLLLDAFAEESPAQDTCQTYSQWETVTDTSTDT